MSQGKINNQSLRSRLADLDSLPGEELHDKSAAWSRLHDRLGEKPRRINPLWYWAAAALIIACSLPFIITHSHPEGIAKEDADKKIQQQQIKADFNKSGEIPIVVAAPASAEEKKTVITKANDRAAIKDSGKNNATAAIPELIVPQQEIIPLPAAQDPQPAIAAAAKKKLRVVSINDLYTPPQESATASSLPPAITGKKFYHIPAATPPMQEYTGVLKIKIHLKH